MAASCPPFNGTPVGSTYFLVEIEPTPLRSTKTHARQVRQGQNVGHLP